MDVFVYGTLTDRKTTQSLLESVEYRGPATLLGLERVDGAYPTVRPGDAVEGTILRTDEIDLLDRYEGVDCGLYIRVSVPLIDDFGGVETGDSEALRNTDSGRESADDPGSTTGSVEQIQSYIGDPAKLGLEYRWPGTGSFESRVQSYLDEQSVFVRRLDSSTE